MSLTEPVRDNLLTLVSVYRKATGISLATASMKFYGNATFFAQLQRGQQSISVKTLDAVLEKMRAAWPDGVAWPSLRPIFMRLREPK
jgi:hypothetical protein